MTLKGRVRGDTPRPHATSASLMAMQTDIHQRKEKGYGKDKHQRETLQHRKCGTAQPPQQRTRLHTPGALTPKRTMVGNEDNGRTGGYKGKVQAAYRAVNAEEGNTYPRGSGRDRGRHDTPAAMRT